MTDITMIDAKRAERAVRPLLPRPESQGPLIPPRNEIETRLADLWVEELRVAPIGIDDSFFELDGDSHSAVALFLAIEEAFGVKLRVSLLLERPTIRLLGEAIREAKAEGEDDPVIAIQPSGSRPPLHVVHGLGGDVINMRQLAAGLGQDQPFYGLRITERLRQPGRLLSMAEIAADYLAAVRRHQPQGPYYLGGFSGGAVIAFEMAQQLRAAGEDVGLLVLLDSPFPLTEGVQRRVSTGTAQLVRVAREEGLGPLASAAWFALSRKFVLAGRRLGLGGVPTRRIGDREVEEPHRYTIILAYRDYRPQPYGGPTLAVVTEGTAARHRSDDLGWRRLVTGPLQVLRVPGDHKNVFHEENVAAYGAELDAILHAAQEGSPA